MTEITFIVKKSVRTQDIRLQRVCTKLQRFSTTYIVQGKRWYVHKQQISSIKNAVKIAIVDPTTDTVKNIKIHIIHVSSTRKHDINKNSIKSYVDSRNIESLEDMIVKEISVALDLPKSILKFDVANPISEVSIPWKTLIFDERGTMYEKQYVAEYVPNAELSSNTDEIDALIENTKNRHVVELQMLQKKQTDELNKMQLWKEALVKLKANQNETSNN